MSADPARDVKRFLNMVTGNLRLWTRSRDFESAAEKLKLSGTIYEPKVKTPVEGVILYIHHIEAKGVCLQARASLRNDLNFMFFGVLSGIKNL